MNKVYLIVFLSFLVSCQKDNINSTLKDIDGNSYKTVTIGTQVWMAENLRVKRYPDGTNIPEVTSCESWASLTQSSEAFCFYDNNSHNLHGGYYTYSAAIKACPKGWHLPTNNEWDQLVIYLYNNGFNNAEGKALKSSFSWKLNGNGSDNMAFSALPSGRKYQNMLSANCIGEFYYIGEFGYWWTSTSNGENFAQMKWLSYDSDKVLSNSEVKKTGFSVRCLKN